MSDYDDEPKLDFAVFQNKYAKTDRHYKFFRLELERVKDMPAEEPKNTSNSEDKEDDEGLPW